jgi:two-component system OmpR family response regulator
MWGAQAPVVAVLVVDPDPHAVTALAGVLPDQSARLTVCDDVADALLQIGRLAPDLVVLSMALRCTEVVTVVAAVRRYLPRMPLLLAVSNGEAESVRYALAAGATACIGRPYVARELLPFVSDARAHAFAQQQPPVVLRCGPIELDAAAYAVRVNGSAVQLPLREFELLRFLMLNADRVVSQDQIRDALWGPGAGESTNTISVHIGRLRARLGDDARDARMLRTIRGLGYRLTAPDLP